MCNGVQSNIKFIRDFDNYGGSSLFVSEQTKHIHTYEKKTTKNH